MEQNLVSDEELLERLNKFLKDSNQNKKTQEPVAETRPEEPNGEILHDVIETLPQETTDGESKKEKNLLLENHCLSLQLQAEKKRSKELQAKFKLFENSVKYFEKLNGQLENIKRAVDEDIDDSIEQTMQKIRPKTIHTAASGIISSADDPTDTTNCEPYSEEIKPKKEDKDEVAFRDAEDFRQLEQGLEIVKDRNLDADPESEKVYITKKEKRCLEDIGNLASRTRAPLDDKHQRYFERDRRKFANSIAMPEIQEVEKSETVPPEIISKTKETPVNITSTELDGLRSYLLQLKELIARRETAWARTTERDYNQRIEINRFKTEVTHLRMLCEKRQRDIKDRDQIIATKDEEIRELQKRIQGLRNAIMKLEKKDDRLIDSPDNLSTEMSENSHLVQRSYNAMKRQSLISRATVGAGLSLTKPANTTTKPLSRSRDMSPKKPKKVAERTASKVKASDSTSNEDNGRPFYKKTTKDKPKLRHRSESLHKTKENYDKVDDKVQRIEEMLHTEVLKGSKKPQGKLVKPQTDIKSLIKTYGFEKTPTDYSSIKKLTPSNSTIRQEMLTAMTGLSTSTPLGLKAKNFPDPKKNHNTAAILANALVAARNSNLNNF